MVISFALWPHRAIIAIDNWFGWGEEGRPKYQLYFIRHRDRTPTLCAAFGQYPTAEHEVGENDRFVINNAKAPAVWWISMTEDQ